jgi:hypothetical protein
MLKQKETRDTVASRLYRIRLYIMILIPGGRHA